MSETAEERANQWQEKLEAAAKVMCPYCRDEKPIEFKHPFLIETMAKEWQHLLESRPNGEQLWATCEAAAGRALTAEVEKLREVARAAGRLLNAGMSTKMVDAWIPGPLSHDYEALVDAWLALPIELRDALGKRGEERQMARPLSTGEMNGLQLMRCSQCCTAYLKHVSILGPICIRKECQDAPLEHINPFAIRRS